MNRTHATATAEEVMFEESEAASPASDDGLPPPTFAQIEYWRKLCGALSQAKGCHFTGDTTPRDGGQSAPLHHGNLHRLADCLSGYARQQMAFL